jgi:hypothetical protein
MHTAKDIRDRHLPHRMSILREYISHRKEASRDGFNCYMDAALITCRSLWGLLGIEVKSRDEHDLGDPKRSFFWFKGFQKIRRNIASEVLIRRVTETELDAFPERDDIKIVLVAANKCVAHFDENLDHAATEGRVDTVVKRLLNELQTRITYSA